MMNCHLPKTLSFFLIFQAEEKQSRIVRIVSLPVVFAASEKPSFPSSIFEKLFLRIFF